VRPSAVNPVESLRLALVASFLRDRHIGAEWICEELLSFVVRKNGVGGMDLSRESLRIRPVASPSLYYCRNWFSGNG